MKTLTIAFSKPRSRFAILSYLIRLFERSNFSHASIRWQAWSIDRQMVYQASHGMAHFVSGGRFDEHAETVSAYEVDLEDDRFSAVVRKCVDLAGTNYGYMLLVGMALERITGLRNPFRDGGKTYVCSELVGEVLRQCGVADLWLDLELYGPKKLEETVSSLPIVRKVI